jgi:hypothetical protein
MDGFLVVMRHGSDDLPLLLTDRNVEAYQFAAAVTADDGRDEMAILKLDATPICVCIYTFVDGKLVECETVKSCSWQ